MTTVFDIDFFIEPNSEIEFERFFQLVARNQNAILQAPEINITDTFYSYYLKIFAQNGLKTTSKELYTQHCDQFLLDFENAMFEFEGPQLTSLTNQESLFFSRGLKDAAQFKLNEIGVSHQVHQLIALDDAQTINAIFNQYQLDKTEIILKTASEIAQNNFNSLGYTAELI